MVHSDNATNFVGAKRDLHLLHQEFTNEQHQRRIKQFCTVRGIKWSTIPPRSPHWGGAWESMVKLFKQHLRRMTNELIFNMESLETLICQIEAILNSRPLCPMSNDASDYTALTPGHFLIGQELNLLPEPVYAEQNFGRLEEWQQRQYLIGQLWKRFMEDVLYNYQIMTKWQNTSENLTVGQLVLLHVDGAPPSRWPLGRIMEISPGPDGLVRVVTVKTAEGTYLRAINKVALLPFKD